MSKKFELVYGPRIAKFILENAPKGNCKDWAFGILASDRKLVFTAGTSRKEVSLPEREGLIIVSDNMSQPVIVELGTAKPFFGFYNDTKERVITFPSAAIRVPANRGFLQVEIINPVRKQKHRQVQKPVAGLADQFTAYLNTKNELSKRHVFSLLGQARRLGFTEKSGFKKSDLIEFILKQSQKQEAAA